MFVLGLMLPLGYSSRTAVLTPAAHSPCSWIEQLPRAGSAASQGSQVCLCLQHLLGTAGPHGCSSFPDCALVLVGLSVFAASTLEHPHGLAFPQLWLCLILVYLKFLFLPPPFCLLAVNFFIDTSFRNCLHLRAANSLLPTSPGFNLYNMFIFTAIFSFYSKPR